MTTQNEYETVCDLLKKPLSYGKSIAGFSSKRISLEKFIDFAGRGLELVQDNTGETEGYREELLYFLHNGQQSMLSEVRTINGNSSDLEKFRGLAEDYAICFGGKRDIQETGEDITQLLERGVYDLSIKCENELLKAEIKSNDDVSPFWQGVVPMSLICSGLGMLFVNGYTPENPPVAGFATALAGIAELVYFFGVQEKYTYGIEFNLEPNKEVYTLEEAEKIGKTMEQLGELTF